MTRDEILAMVPGREFDALIAEKVMVTHGSYWSYSRDINKAWYVVDKMKDYQFFIRRLPTLGYSAGFNSSIVIARTAPEAICKAALLAMEVPE